LVVLVELSSALRAPRAGGSLPDRAAVRAGPGLVELLERRVLVVEVDDDRAAADAGRRGRTALDHLAAGRLDDLHVLGFRVVLFFPRRRD